MNIHDLILGKIADLDFDNEFPYQFQLHCKVDDKIDIPDSVRKKYPEQILFVISSTLNHNITYDYENQIFSFDATFGGAYYRVSMKPNNINGILDELDGSFVNFGLANTPNRIEEKKKEQKKEKPKRPVLRIVSDNSK